VAEHLGISDKTLYKREQVAEPVLNNFLIKYVRYGKRG